FLGAFDPHLQRLSELQLANQLNQPIESWIGRATHAPPGSVADAIYRVQRDRHYHVSVVTRLQNEQYRARGNRGHQLLKKIHAGEWRINYGRTVGVLALRRGSAGKAEGIGDGGGAGGGEGRSDRALKLISGYDLRDGEKHRGVAVTELDYVQKSLLF